jgi:methylated-DNA-[protein]-cysteine S-methyltransferase
MHHTTVTTTFGLLKISSDGVGICEIVRLVEPLELDASPSTDPLLVKATQAVFDFCLGIPGPLSVLPLSLQGTEFQKAVWEQLRTIPFGEVRSYGEVASRIGKPSAARAVGAACSKNPVMLAVPCHRVIGASGALTGFAGGLDMKTALLDFEKRQEFSTFHYRNSSTFPLVANL